MKTLFALALSCAALSTYANFNTRVVARNLSSPTGIVATGQGRHTYLFVTQLPTPGIPGSLGGSNTVDAILPNGSIFNITRGEPEPTNLALDRHFNLYWTCKSAGVILRRTPFGTVAPVATGLQKPTGLAVDSSSNLFLTQLPTPGIPGSMSGTNTVDRLTNGNLTNLTIGEPEPTDIAVNRHTGDLYWTCKSAGVILKRDAAGVVSLFLKGLNKPTGIAVNQRNGKVVFTEVPTPGVPGSMGGGNFVWEVNPRTGARKIVDFGDPQPTDVAVSDDGSIYWTCTSAGVVVCARED